MKAASYLGSAKALWLARAAIAPEARPTVAELGALGLVARTDARASVSLVAALQHVSSATASYRVRRIIALGYAERVSPFDVELARDERKGSFAITDAGRRVIGLALSAMVRVFGDAEPLSVLLGRMVRVANDSPAPADLVLCYLAARGPMAVGPLSAASGLYRSTVSNSLSRLASASLVFKHEGGQLAPWELSPAATARVRAFVRHASGV